jgi:hypothetical protein
MEQMMNETGLNEEMMLDADPNFGVTPDIEETPETEEMAGDGEVNQTNETENNTSDEDTNSEEMEVRIGNEGLGVEADEATSTNVEAVTNEDLPTLDLDLDPILTPILPDPEIVLPPFVIPPSDQVWSQNSPNIEGGSEDFDHFGEVVATGDFDGDGYDDLAIGVPNEDLGSGANEITNAGAVNILYGSAFGGLGSTGDQIWHQNSSGVLGVAEAFDNFGSSLAAGDFNDDGYDDLAIGVPGEDVGTINAAGAVNILYGSASGLTATGDQIFDQDDVNGSSAEIGDNFGGSLTTGDFDGDGYVDLVVGSPNENWNGIPGAGMAHAIYGSSTGLTTVGNDWFSQQNLSDTPEDFDNFAFSLTAGDFDDDGDDDLAIGVPFEDIGTITNAGAIHVVNGTNNGLTTSGDQFLHQDSSGIADIAEAFDDFGYSLASGDFDNDDYDDLAIGVPFEDLGTGTNAITNAGAVNVLYGSANSVTGTGDQFWHQDVSGIQGEAEGSDQFGFSLSAGDFDNDSYDDLAVGVRYEDLAVGPDEITNAGAVNIIRGSATNLNHRNDRLITQATLDMSDEPAEAFDNFGYSLAVGDFNGDNYGDLAVGLPFEDVDVFASTTNSGSVNVLYDV